MIELRKGNCIEEIAKIKKERDTSNIIIVSDPPFNTDRKYNTYKDNLEEEDYYNTMGAIFSEFPSVIIHYPEPLYRIAAKIQKYPTKIISWVYNANTPRQHRQIAFFDVSPDFTQVTQPYKNPNDKRIKARIAAGKTGGRLYDWWNINQVKNTNKEKTSHPCQMPLEVMKNIIGILPKDCIILDPFMGSGTTGVAAKKLGRDFIGIEIDETYFSIAKERIEVVE
jgi:site-specific DNA-methyltransferase (adenine-specific)